MTSSLREHVAATEATMIARLDVGQYRRMVEQGILREGQPVELIDGLLLRRDRADRGGDPMIHGPRHALVIARLQLLHVRLGSSSCHVRCQLPLALGEYTEPEPDAAVVRGSPDDYACRHPGPSDVLAVIEAADSSLHHDRETKLRVYAAARIPVYWIINIAERTIEVHTLPEADSARYRTRAVVPESGCVALDLGAGGRLEVRVAELLP